LARDHSKPPSSPKARSDFVPAPAVSLPSKALKIPPPSHHPSTRCEKMMKHVASTSQRKTASRSDSEYDTALTCHLLEFFQLPAKTVTPAGGVLLRACEWQLRDMSIEHIPIAHICLPFKGNLPYLFSCILFLTLFLGNFSKKTNMKTAVTWVYKSSRDTIKEKQEHREWRRTYDPTFVSRKSMLAQKYRSSRQSVMGIFRPRSM
jgi:hypothetical protein